MGKAPKKAGRLTYGGVKTKPPKYLSRAQALKKLQISIKDFRRLCILKGIYPRNPPMTKKNKKKGYQANRTYFYYKDIVFLAHEPLLKNFREQKAFLKKYKKAKNKEEYKKAKSLARSLLPNMTLDHIIKERYPTFQAALADLDDCLTMVHLFSEVSFEKYKSGKLPELSQLCAQLAAEFDNYVIASRSLRKVFLSIKGIYYQADIQGIPVTWIVPYRFTQTIPTDVDLRVMQTFLELYTVLLRFVNFKLYNDLGLVYPPPVRNQADNSRLSSYAMVAKAAAASNSKQDAIKAIAAVVSKPTTAAGAANKAVQLTEEQKQQQQQQITNLAKKLTAASSDKQQDEEEENENDANNDNINGEDKDVFSALMNSTADGKAESNSNNDNNNNNNNNEDETTAAAAKQKQLTPEEKQKLIEKEILESFKNLFTGCVFFLGRENQQDSLEFVIRAFGGRVGWDGPGSSFKADDPSITHQICDRPAIPTPKYNSRDYVQPQWVYDSINARVRLPVEPYAVGAKLPPHLSPFATYEDNSYVPKYAETIRELAKRHEANVAATAGAAISGGGGGSGSGSVSGVPSADVQDKARTAEDDAELDEEERRYQAELKAESAGISYSQHQRKLEAAKRMVEKQGKSKKQMREERAQEELKKTGKTQAELNREKEERELRIQMMSNTQRKLYNRIMRHKEFEARKAQELTARAERIERREKEEALAEAAKKRKAEAEKQQQQQQQQEQKKQEATNNNTNSKNKKRKAGEDEQQQQQQQQQQEQPQPQQQQKANKKQQQKEEEEQPQQPQQKKKKRTSNNNDDDDNNNSAANKKKNTNKQAAAAAAPAKKQQQQQGAANNNNNNTKKKKAAKK